MTTYASLSAADQKSLGDFMLLLRPLAVSHGHALNVVAAVQAQYSLNVFAILNGLTGSEVVLDGTGLAGATQMTAADIMAMVQDVGALSTEDAAGGTGRATRRVKAAGANNLIG